MAKKKTVNKDIETIKDLIGNDNFIIGTERTIDAVREGTAKQVFLSSNCPEDIKSELGKFASITGVPIIQIDIPNEELGTLCRKPFSISVLCEKKE